MSNPDQIEPPSTRTTRSTRNPRRRQRQSDGDSLKTSAPRRKRSKLSENTFTPPETKPTQEITTDDMNGELREPRASRGSKRDSTPAAPDGELVIRGGKRGSLKRAIKGDGARLLTHNRTYSVKLLPSTPRDLTKEGVDYRGSIGAGHHALALTREKAYVWDYLAHTSASNVREFPIPLAIAATDPLPFGAVVVNGASPDVGLLLVSARTGKLFFYENIERAASIGLFHERHTGVEGSLGTLHSGEMVTDVISAEHAGFVVVLSSGRIFRLTLRDSQGRPKVLAQFLRSEDTSQKGFFGSIKGFLGNMLHRGITAVHTRALGGRGHMQVLALSEKCEMQAWDLDWSGSYEYKGIIDFRELISEELKSMESPETQGRAEAFSALDFAIADRNTFARGNEVATATTEQPLDAWVLLRIGDGDALQYMLAEIRLRGDEAGVKRVNVVETYDARVDEKPKLLLPKPGHTGYVIFEHAVSLFATADIAMDGPEAQLHSSYQDLRPFEDTVYLRPDKNVCILDAVDEETKGNHASCIVFTKSAGLVRFSAIDPAGDINRTRISAEDKIEQAVIYGSKDDNILDFANRTGNGYAIEEVEAAAPKLSKAILSSQLPTISKTPTSIEDHLALRAKYLRTLINHVLQNYPAVSKRTLWNLRWDAEKLAAGQELWKTFEEHKAASGKVKRTATIMDAICLHAQDEYAWANFNSQGDDLVYQMLVHGLDHLSELLPLVRPTLEFISQDKTEPAEKVVRVIRESDELWIRTLKAVFQFRENNAEVYGVPRELICDGVLIENAMYAELPEFWTSTESMLKAIVKIASLSRDIANDIFNRDDVTPELEARIQAISSENPRLIEILCTIHQERIYWMESRSSAKDRQFALKLKDNFEERRQDQFRELLSIGQADAAMTLAEKYHDMHTLTLLIVQESQYYLGQQQEAQTIEEQNVVAQHLETLLKRTGRYFERFGEEWANAFFDEAFSSSRAGLMLDEAQNNWAEALTRYLRSHKNRSKICWINDILAEKDFHHGSAALATSGLEQETKLWDKKIELSLSKLALLAANEESQIPQMDAQVEMRKRGLEMVSVQEAIYMHMRPVIISGIDRQAELELAMSRFATREHDLPSLRRLLESDLERILSFEALSLEDLIDTLTLIDNVLQTDKPDSLVGSEFFLALAMLDRLRKDMSHDKAEMLLRLIWKRCFIYDDWTAVNKKQGKKNFTEAEIRRDLRQTAAWRTIHLLRQDATTNIPTLKPSECIGAGCQELDLAGRFPDELVAPILRDNRVQDEILQENIADRRLEEWVERIDTEVRKEVDAEREDEAARNAKAREIERSTHANGHIDGIKQEEIDGDVAMA